MRRYSIAAVFAALVLASAAVTLGGLNQDEGWYLYAAQLVGEGRMPYRDFFYTQGPLMPVLYSFLAPVWKSFGLLGARVLTAALGLLGCAAAAALARRLVPEERRSAAGTAVFLLLACNLYHLYYVAIPKTYALAALFVSVGFLLLAHAVLCSNPMRAALAFAAGFVLALAAGTRISLGALLAAGGFALLLSFRRFGWTFLWFGLGGALGLASVYGPFLLDDGAREGLLAAQKYHAARGGFSPVFVVGSLSRLVRWYLPVFILFGLGASVLAKRDGHPSRFLVWTILAGFLAVFGVQMLAPFPYEDYQVPVMGLLAAVAAALAVRRAESDGRVLLLALGLAFASSFGSPLLEKWTTDGQDRFWTIKKEKPEIFALRDAARAVNELDPDGGEMLTQDLYLAVEAGRKVPRGLEMGPFSMLSADEWRGLLESVTCPVAALSGYSFAVEPPECSERDAAEQREFRSVVEKRYELKTTFERFGQNATTLGIYRRRESE